MSFFPNDPTVGDTVSVLGKTYQWTGTVWKVTGGSSFDGAFSSLTGTPTTIAGYGITDAFDGAFGSLTGTPTTIAGYGITDSPPVDNPTFTGTLNADVVSVGDGVDAILTADAANILAMRNGANANELRIYNTYTDASNNEFFAIDWNTQANVVTLKSIGSGTGTSRDIDVYNGATRSLRLTTSQVKVYRNIRFNSTVYDLGESTTSSCPRNIFSNNKFATAGYFEQTSETTADPTTTEYPADTNWGIHRNTTSGNVFLAYNDGGSIIKKVLLEALGTTFTQDVLFDTGVQERYSTLVGATGVVAHDCDNGHIFRHTSPAADFTANFTNLGLNDDYATTISLVIEQGATAYIANAIQIGGVAQTVNWQGGLAPSGTNNGVDIISFSILDLGSSYLVVGQLVDFA